MFQVAEGAFPDFKCPYCGACYDEDRDRDYFDWEYTKVLCHNCGRDFKVRKIVHTSYEIDRGSLTFP